MSMPKTASTAAQERWDSTIAQRQADAALIEHIRNQAEESISLIERKGEMIIAENASFAASALEKYGMAALTDLDMFLHVYQGLMLKRVHLEPSPLSQAVARVLRENVPFFHHVYIDTMGGQEQRDDTLQIRLVIPNGSDHQEIRKAAEELTPLLNVQDHALPRLNCYGYPSATVQLDQEYGKGSCVVWLRDGEIKIPDPMGGGTFPDLNSALLEAQKRSNRRGFPSSSR